MKTKFSLLTETQNSSKNWYVIYTKPKCEKKVAEQLAKKKVKCYCPLKSMTRDNAAKRKLIAEPLFTSYVFVSLGETELSKVRQIDGIISFVHWLDKPAVIGNEEIETLRKYIKDYSEVQLEKIHVNLNDHVRIINEPLIKREGDLLKVCNNVVKVVLPSLGYMLVTKPNKGMEENVVYLSLEEI